MHSVFRYVLWLCYGGLLLLHSVANAQAYRLLIHCETPADSAIAAPYIPKDLLGDSLRIAGSLDTLMRQLHQKAYLAASIDSLSAKDSTLTAYLHVGSTYRWCQLTPTPSAVSWLSRAGYRQLAWQGKPLLYTKWQQLQTNLLQTLEDNGYPFAMIQLTDPQWQSDSLSAMLAIHPNRFVTFDTVRLEGNARIAPAFLGHYLGIKKGSPYKYSTVQRIKSRLQELPYLREIKGTTLTFSGDKAIVNVYVERKKASKFDFLVGVAPNTATQTLPNAPTRLLLTGNFNADMSNQFGVGERIVVAFEQLRPLTQRLNLQLTYPYIFNLPIGIEAKFDLYKRDTSYLDVWYDAGLQYLFAGNNYVKIFYNRVSSSLLTVNKPALISQRQLPTSLDVATTTVGLEVLQQKLDYRFNPRKGWSVWVRGGVGNKVVSKNNEILAFSNPADPTFNYAALYDSLVLRTLLYNTTAHLAYYLPLAKRMVLKTAVQGGGIFSSQPIYQNEQFRLGGNRLLRGFNEEAFFATQYAIGTVEYRLLLGINSYLFTFADYGWTQTERQGSTFTDTPLGLGAGMTFDAKIGIFSVSTAWGRTREVPFDYRAARIHFGYINFF